MKIRIRNFFAAYLASWWLPAVCYLGLLLLLVPIVFAGTRLTNATARGTCELFTTGLFLLLGLLFLGIAFAFLWNLLNKRWLRGVANLAALVVCGGASMMVLGFIAMEAMFGPSEDGFADNLTIPTDIAVANPLEELKGQPGEPADTFQASLMESLKGTGSDDPTVTADIASLAQLQRTSPDLLKRYLATSPAWRLFTERGSVFATRRWMLGSEWETTLNGYYTPSDLGIWTGKGPSNFQSLVAIGLSGKALFEPSAATQLQPGQSRPLALTEGNQMQESRCVVTDGPLVVENFEQSPARERRLTKAALQFLNDEFRPLANSPTAETLRASLPTQSIKRGPASFDLRNSFQPGIYNTVLWLNPGEPGTIYLKAYEVTKGTRLSEERLQDASNERIGWSSDPEEKFFSNTNITIYEGDWGKPYAARFEIWFIPDSGTPERKLTEKVFKIEGWQR